jgi:histone H3/H4
MKTGFDPTYDASAQNEQLAKTMIDIITPVIEKGMILAAEYAKACGRNAVLVQDVEYAMKYCAMHEVGQQIGSYFPEIYEDDGDDLDDMEIVEEGEMEFTRYTGDEQRFKAMNDAKDSWDTWVPSNPTEELIKNAIDSNGQ